MREKMYVTVTEICNDWGVSKPQAYKMIRQMNQQMQQMNPHLIVVAGKVNRKFYEESCYGLHSVSDSKSVRKEER
ncbi:MAG: hypothetical protein U0K57_01095 [Lachnospiraceae bacterium]|nr:hypothetical protein [Lachnospiraceae bacterium]